MSTLGLYVPGSSLLHRARTGHKLLALALAGAGSVLVSTPWHVAGALLVVLALYVVARLPVRLLVAQVRPVLPVLVLVAVFQVLVVGWQAAVVVVGVIGVLVLAAGLVTLTTRTEDLVDAVVAGLRRVQRLLPRIAPDPERVGLLLALSVRTVPVVVGLAEEVRDAQRARGARLSARAFAAPMIIRALRHADDLGEALVARGVDD